MWIELLLVIGLTVWLFVAAAMLGYVLSQESVQLVAKATSPVGVFCGCAIASLAWPFFIIEAFIQGATSDDDDS